jgi:hypothetical protein
LNSLIDVEAGEGDDEDEDEEINDDLNDDGDAKDEVSPVRSSQVMALPGPLAKDRLALNIDDIFHRYKENPVSSLQSLRASPYKATSFSGTILSNTSLQSLASGRMYRLRAQGKFTGLSMDYVSSHLSYCIEGSATDYIANHLREKGFPVFVSAWMSGELYVTAESPNSIAVSLPPITFPGN